MRRKNVIGFLNDIATMMDDYGEVHLERAFYTPSFIIPFVAYFNSHPIAKKNFGVDPRDNKSYFQTIGLYKQLWREDDNIVRNNCGRTYSPIVCLDSVEHVDQATTEIGSCIKSMTNSASSKGLSKLLDVIGEVHDNVWSHGKSTGFSMAQIYNDPEIQKKFIEFTLADKGFGFRNEMKKSGKNVNTHKEAIEWCIQEGNSTKHADDEDPWKQRIPSDLLGENPMGDFGGEVSDDHHQGLGLFHLIDLVETFNGELYLVSGDVALHIKNNVREYLELNYEWQGVIISCRFDNTELQSSTNRKIVDDENINNIIRRLRGD